MWKRNYSVLVHDMEAEEPIANITVPYGVATESTMNPFVDCVITVTRYEGWMASAVDVKH